MSASHPSEAATRVTVGDHTFFPDNAARDLEAMAYEYETNLRFKLDSTSAGLFLRNVAHGLRMCARTFDLAARSPAPSDETWGCTAARSHGRCNTVNEADDATCGACGEDRPPAAPSVEARDADEDERTVEQWHDDAMKYANEVLDAKGKGLNYVAGLYALIAFNCELAALRRASRLNASLATRTVLLRSLTFLAADAFTPEAASLLPPEKT